MSGETPPVSADCRSHDAILRRIEGLSVTPSLKAECASAETKLVPG